MDSIAQRLWPAARLSAAVVVVLLLLAAPLLGGLHLNERGHDHSDATRVAVEAVHTTLPAHFESSAAASERECSACLVQGRTMGRPAPAPRADYLPPAESLDHAIVAGPASKSRHRLDLSRAPPILL